MKSDLFAGYVEKVVDTAYGKAIVNVDASGNSPCVFVQRHHADGEKGAEVYNPPHIMNQKAYLSALKHMVRSVGTSSA